MTFISYALQFYKVYRIEMSLKTKHKTLLEIILLIALVSLQFVSCWKDKSPEDLIRLK